ncbi:MAG TPA: hypothetical protein PLS84_09070 [Salinivirgaceae bacterium]|nr:hypothetical protein [Salinivirgaceae bacterium]HQB22788.1 hypothetical protein [Bacteroidales bacterium]
MNTKLSFGGIILQGIKLGIFNILSILVAIILWALTIWIPYLNVGTTIGLISMPIGMSKGNIMSPTEIFKRKYRQYMGEFFILTGLKAQGLLPALLFLVIPYIILNLAWSQATYLLLDKGVNPAEALTLSNKMTDGHKAKIFFAKLILTILSFGILYPFFMMGASAYIYKSLSEDVE